MNQVYLFKLPGLALANNNGVHGINEQSFKLAVNELAQALGKLVIAIMIST